MTTPDAHPDPPRAVYAERRDRHGAERDRLHGEWNLVANLRLAAFVAAAAGAAWAVWGGQRAGWAVAALGLLAFVVLMAQHRRLGAARDREATLHDINAEALARLDRDWAALPPCHAVAPPGHAYAGDLDLFGHASLMQLLDTTATDVGQRVLAGWLLAPADPATVARRQDAVRDLAPRLDLRQELEAQGRRTRDAQGDAEPFLAWAEGPPWLAARAWLRAWSFAGPLLLVAAIALQATGRTSLPLWVAAFGLNALVALTVGRPATRVVETVAARSRALAGYAAPVEVLTGARFDAPAMRDLQAALAAGGEPAPELLRRLGRIAAFQMPQSAPVAVLLQGSVLWDVHVAAALERWQAVAGPRVRGWLATLGEVEALGALAGLAHDEPGWAFPTLDPEADAYRATALGHPLLPDDVRISNDVAVGPAGSFLLVTGSNMSGKSTLLRAIGTNAVLAGAGGPVCAEALSLPPFELWTSVRVQDSLERGVSFFLAELQRLKLVADAARRARRQGTAPVLYLLDEILQGTNSAERQVAARRIIADLVAQGAVGAVSTHDLALADDPDLAPHTVAVHFTDLVGDGVDAPLMHFDYRLRPGVATTTNALRLMELVGFGAEDDAVAPFAPAG